MKDARRSIKDLKLKADLNYNAESFSIQTKEAREILDHIRRIENLNATYELLLEKFTFAVTCNDCPFIEGCIYQEGSISDCKLKMASRTNNLGVNI